MRPRLRLFSKKNWHGTTFDRCVTVAQRWLVVVRHPASSFLGFDCCLVWLQGWLVSSAGFESVLVRLSEYGHPVFVLRRYIGLVLRVSGFRRMLAPIRIVGFCYLSPFWVCDPALSQSGSGVLVELTKISYFRMLGCLAAPFCLIFFLLSCVMFFLNWVLSFSRLLTAGAGTSGFVAGLMFQCGGDSS